MTTLRRDGNVLIPTDSTGRALELLVCLEQYWQLYKYVSDTCHGSVEDQTDFLI